MTEEIQDIELSSTDLRQIELQAQAEQARVFRDVMSRLGATILNLVTGPRQDGESLGSSYRKRIVTMRELGLHTSKL